jgi:hypothetical protein
VPCGAGRRNRPVLDEDEGRRGGDREAVERLRVDLEADLALADDPLHAGHGLLQRVVHETAQQQGGPAARGLIDQALQGRVGHREAHEDQQRRAHGHARLGGVGSAHGIEAAGDRAEVDLSVGLRLRQCVDARGRGNRHPGEFFIAGHAVLAPRRLDVLVGDRGLAAGGASDVGLGHGLLPDGAWPWA